MPLRLEIVSRHRQTLGERGIKEFGQAGGTLGRSVDCDWVLPDGQRYLSNRHASIDYRSGSYYLVDTSTNGVYVNGADTPVGRGKPQRLFSGDRLRIGEYEMAVVIEDEADHTREQLFSRDHVDPVDLAQRVPPPEPTGEQLLHAHEITGVGIELLLKDEEEEEERARRAASDARAAAPPRKTATQNDLPQLELAPDPAPARASAAAAVAAPVEAPAASAPAASQCAAPAARTAAPAPPAAARGAASSAGTPPKRSEPQAPTPPRSTSGRPSAALEPFFRGAGLDPQPVDEKLAELVLHRLGQLMRETIIGIAENLRVRAEQKNTLRTPNTTIQPQGNNPLKFAASVDEALLNLLFRESSEYMPAVEAVRETFIDVKLHQLALLSAARAAVGAYVSRLDPDELESKYASGKRGPLINAANKLKYWDVYKDLYQVVTQHAPGQFPPQFLEELAQAYEQEIARAAGGQRAKTQAKAV